MTHEERQKFILEQRKERDKIMSVNNKGGEYSRSDKANANFWRIAEQLDSIPEKVCLIYLYKHLDAVTSAVDAMTSTVNIDKVPSESIDSRLHDIANYVEILHSIIHERKGK